MATSVKHQDSADISTELQDSAETEPSIQQWTPCDLYTEQAGLGVYVYYRNGSILYNSAFPRHQVLDKQQLTFACFTRYP